VSVASLVKKAGLGKLVKKSPALERALGLFYYGVFRPPYFSRMVDVDIGGAGVFRLDYRFGHYNYESFGDAHNDCFRLWVDLCRGKRTVLDIGAHIGLYALAACRRSAGTVYAFEPSEGNQGYLRRHAAYNGLRNMVVVPALVGEADREAVFFESREPDAMNSIVPAKRTAARREVRRRQVTLDAFCAENGLAPELVKMDVEGAELNAFLGAREVFRRHRPVIILSAHPSRIEALGQRTEDLERIIDELGYEVTDAAGRPSGRLEFGEYVLRPRG
jgi:FkbM family methyltransferase